MMREKVNYNNLSKKYFSNYYEIGYYIIIYKENKKKLIK
jgi:hypothetical protein